MFVCSQSFFPPKSVSTPDESCEVVEDLDRDIDVLLANVGAKLKASVREGNTLQTLELWRQLLETKSSGSVENDGVRKTLNRFNKLFLELFFV